MKNPFREHIRFGQTVKRAIREGRTGELLQTLREREQLRKKRHTEFQEIQRTVWRPMLHESMDGATELVVATMCLGFALSACTFVLLKPSLWRTWLGLLLLICGGFGPYHVRKAIKEHITWPRTGYVAGLQERKSSPKWRVAALLLVLGMGILSTCWQLREMRRQGAGGPAPISQAAITGIPMNRPGCILRDVFAAGNVVMYLGASAVRMRKQPWMGLLLAIMVAGALVIRFLAYGTLPEAMLPLMLFFGLVWLISGVASLCSYLRNHPPLPPETE
jgi:protein-S-isoprenylcysteine O-methyltransferase Ste14